MMADIAVLKAVLDPERASVTTAAADDSAARLRLKGSQPGGTPTWFRRAVDENKPDHTDIEVNGCRIHLRLWGAPGRPAMVFVHGGGAHSGWWDHIAPFFAATHRVAAVDLSGHGDSGFRSEYRQ